MVKTGRLVGVVMALVLSVGHILALSSEAQELSVQTPQRVVAPASSPDKLPKILAEGTAKLKEDIAALRQEEEAAQQMLEQLARDTEELRGRVAALNAAMALKKLTLAETEEEVKALTQKEAELDGQIKALKQKQEALNTASQENASSLAAVQREMGALKTAKHPVLRSQEMKNAQQQYQKLARQFAAAAGTYKEVLARNHELLSTQKTLLTATKTHIVEEYLGKTLQEEILKRQSVEYRLRQFANVLRALFALPGKAYTWLRHGIQSGLLVRVIRHNWATLIGLFLFLLLLGLGTHRLRGTVVPAILAWQSQVPELGLQALLHFVQILIAHLFSIGLVAWLYVAFRTLGIIDTKAAWLIFSLVATVVVLRLVMKMVYSLFAGKAARGILPLPEDLARFYRRQLRFLALYFFLVGTFIVPNTRYLGFTPEEGNFFQRLFQIALLGWILWLLRSRYLDRLLEALPLPGFVKSKGFLRAIRTTGLLVFGFVVISGLLGFRFLSDYVAEAATFTVVVLALAWIAGEAAYAGLRLTLHPDVGFLGQKYPEQEQLLFRLYQLLTWVVITALIVVVVFGALKFWGLEPAWVAWAFQWLTWGPSLGPIKLSLVNIGLTVLIIYLGLWISRLIRTFLEFTFYPTTDWDTGIQYTISMTIHYVVLVITALIALNAMGISLTSLALVAGGLGVGIGFGLQNIVSNFISGLILLFERPIKVGDMLVIDGQWGMVKEIRVRSTIFQTFDRYILIIPNSDLISGKILNWTHFGWGINRLTLKVGVSYGSDPRQVTKIIEEVCRANPRVIADPPPQVFFEAYGDNSLNFNIWVHLGTPGDRIPATHELNSAIFQALQAHGIEIPFPQRDLHVRTWSPEASPVPPASPKE
jgi:potassium efflux system protein